MQNIASLQQNGINLNDTEKNELQARDIADEQYVLRVENLCKTYDGNHQALINVSFGLKSGEVRNVALIDHSSKSG